MRENETKHVCNLRPEFNVERFDFAEFVFSEFSLMDTRVVRCGCKASQQIFICIYEVGNCGLCECVYRMLSEQNKLLLHFVRV